MPYRALKVGDHYVLAKPGSRKRAKHTGKRFSSKAKAMAQAYAIMKSEQRRAA